MYHLTIRVFDHRCLVVVGVFLCPFLLDKRCYLISHRENRGGVVLCVTIILLSVLDLCGIALQQLRHGRRHGSVECPLGSIGQDVLGTIAGRDDDVAATLHIEGMQLAETRGG